MALPTVHDVFISYAHADDETPHGAEYGWVTTFKEELRKRLRQKLGGSGADIWMDHLLAANYQVTPTLLQTLQQSRTLLLFLSPSYQKSEWCQKELGEFLQHNQADKNKENVFIVEIEPVDRNNWHPLLRDLTAIRFWEKNEVHPAPRLYGYPTPDPKENSPYWLRLNEVAHYIAEHLRKVLAIASSAGAVPTAPVVSATSKPLIWLAEPSEDLISQWYEIAAALRQNGCDLCPTGPQHYDRTSTTSFERELRQDLTVATLYIQLLGTTPGSPTENGTTYTALQNSVARAVALEQRRTLLQWRDPSIVLNNIEDPAYRQLITGATASGFEEFRQSVLKTVKALAEAPPAGTDATQQDSSSSQPRAGRSQIEPAIYVNANIPDKNLGQSVIDILDDLGAEALFAPDPSPTQLPAEYLAELDEIIKGSEGLIIVYGETHPAWVQAQYVRARKLLAQTPRTLWGALLDGPPKIKPPHGVSSKNLMLLDCRDGVDRGHLAQFVDKLREQPNA